MGWGCNIDGKPSRGRWPIHMYKRIYAQKREKIRFKDISDIDLVTAGLQSKICLSAVICWFGICESSKTE